MPPLGDQLQTDTVIDISHESLMRVWERLKGWVHDEAQSAQMFRRLQKPPSCMPAAMRICGAIRICRWRWIGAREISRTKLGRLNTDPILRARCTFWARAKRLAIKR